MTPYCPHHEAKRLTMAQEALLSLHPAASPAASHAPQYMTSADSATMDQQCQHPRELARNAQSRLTPELLGQHLHFNKIPGQFICTLMSGKH